MTYGIHPKEIPCEPILDLFSEFYKMVRGVEPSADLVEMFMDCKGDENEAN